MADIAAAAAAPTASTAPVSTADIATQIIADSNLDATLDGSADATVESTGGDASVETITPKAAAAVTPETPVIEEATTVPATTDTKDDLLNVDFKTLTPAQRKGRIKVEKVEKIIENAVAKERAVQQTQLKEVADKATAYEQRLSEVAQVERIMTEQPEKFLEMLATLPAYQRLVGATSGAANAPAAHASAAGTAMPKPNVKLEDGSMTYDIDGLQALMDWQAAQVEARVVARYAPIEQEHRSKQFLADLQPKIEAQVKEARTWPQFTENENAIVAAMQATKGLSLEGAYRQVVYPKLAASKDDIRAQVLAELKQQPRGTAVAGTGSASSSSGPRTTEQIARDILRSSK